MKFTISFLKQVYKRNSSQNANCNVLHFKPSCHHHTAKLVHRDHNIPNNSLNQRNPNKNVGIHQPTFCPYQ